MSNEQPSHGVGRLVLSSSTYSPSARFTTSYFTYPLKVIVPAVTRSIKNLGAAYLINYGGGLLDGDRVDLDVNVGRSCRAILLSLGSTKVYKRRDDPADRQEGSLSRHGSKQMSRITIEEEASLFLLPESVTPFANASYSQYQEVKMTKISGLCLLDWVHAGRLSRQERWAFDQYRSWTEVLLDDTVVLREMLDLDLETGRTAERVKSHTTLATLILIGKVMKPLILAFEREWDQLEIRPKKTNINDTTDELLWSMSPITTFDTEHGAIVRLAGNSTESVRDFLARMMKAGLSEMIGRDLTRQIFP